MTPSLPTFLHPTRERLQSFVLNRLSPDETAIVRNHLRICSECQHLIQRIQNNDPISETQNENVDAAAIQTKPLVNFKEEIDSALPIPAALAHHPRYKVLNVLGAG